jgi:hypothetical protein
MDERAAIERARKAAAKAGWQLTKFRRPEASQDGSNWRVYFAGRAQRPGNHFSVVVNGRTGSARVIPGR